MSALALITLLAVAGPPGPAGDLDRAYEVFDQLDTARMTLDVADEPLLVVLDRLEEKLGVPIRGHWSALDLDGIEPDDRVSLRADRSPASGVLRALTLELGDPYNRPVFEVHAGELVLTSLEGSSSMHLTTVYDVRDLVMRQAVFDVARDRVVELHDEADRLRNAEEPDEDVEEPDETEGPGEDGWAPIDLLDLPAPHDVASPDRSPGEELLLLLIEHIDPEAWIDYGGSRARITESSGVFVVSATPSVHRRLTRSLAELRTIYATGVSIEAAIVEIPRALLAEKRRRFDDRSAALARTLVNHAESTVLWRTSGVVALARPLLVETDASERSIRLEVSATIDPAQSAMFIDVEASFVSGQDRSTVKTTATAPVRNGGVFVELPGGTPGDTVRALLLIPTTH